MRGLVPNGGGGLVRLEKEEPRELKERCYLRGLPTLPKVARGAKLHDDTGSSVPCPCDNCRMPTAGVIRICP